MDTFHKRDEMLVHIYVYISFTHAFFSVPVGHLQCLTSAWGRGRILSCRQSSYFITLWHFIGKKKPCTKQRPFISTLAANQEKRERELENRRVTAIEKQVCQRKLKSKTFLATFTCFEEKKLHVYWSFELNNVTRMWHFPPPPKYLL